MLIVVIIIYFTERYSYCGKPTGKERKLEKRARGPRVEGRSKVTGAAVYVDDMREDELGFGYDVAVAVSSTCAVGRVKTIDTRAALAVPGVKLVMTHANAPRLKKVFAFGMGEVGELLPLQSDTVCYRGQCVAVVVADSLMAAQEGARLVEVTYEPTTQAAAFTLSQAGARLSPVKRAGIAPGSLQEGDAIGDYEAASARVDAEYHCAPHHHNAIEPSAVVAKWDRDGGITIHAAVQWHHIETVTIGQAFGLGPGNRLSDFIARMFLGRVKEHKVRLRNKMSGGAFGRNIHPIHLFLACMAAKLTNTAVKVILTREQTYTLLPYRGEVRQRLRIGANENGTLQAIVQEPDVAVGAAGKYVEPVGEVPLQLYAHKSHYLQHRVARLDLNGVGWMRGPGVSSAVFAVESAMDELAHQQVLDPLELRLLNHADINPETSKPWSSKSLRECYAAGAEAIGWRDRLRGGTLREDGRIVGYGLSTSFDLGRQFPASAKVSLRNDGSAVVSVAAAELGQGILSALTTIAAESLGIGREQIVLETHGADLPYAAGSIGSTGTFSNGTAIYEAAAEIKRKLIGHTIRDKASPLFGESISAVTIGDGYLRSSRGASESVVDAMRRYDRTAITYHAKTGRTFGRSKSAKASFGAVFIKISVDPITMHLRVEKMVGAFACGRIIEPVLARNQVVGGMIWGMGQALFEETRVDQISGKWVNANLAEALIATHADIPEIDLVFIDEDDTASHPLGAKGLAEIGVVGPAPAIANAFFDATGKRLRSLPLLIEDRLVTPTADDRQTDSRIEQAPAATSSSAIGGPAR